MAATYIYIYIYYLNHHKGNGPQIYTLDKIYDDKAIEIYSVKKSLCEKLEVL